MPAYSFQERFVPFVIDASKPHTIRARRQKGFAKIGDQLYLYFGMRTKWCKKLREELCKNVRTIVITATDIYLYNFRLDDKEAKQEEEYVIKHGQPSGGIRLDTTLRNTLAWADGFRPEGSTKKKPGESFELMISFWCKTHDIAIKPFIGDLIDWTPTPEGLQKAKIHV